MKKSENYNVLSNKCLKIIKSSSPEKSISKISKLKLSDSSKVGTDKALKIYKFYGDDSVEYKSSLYSHNIVSYQSKVNNNVKRASNFASTK